MKSLLKKKKKLKRKHQNAPFPNTGAICFTPNLFLVFILLKTS